MARTSSSPRPATRANEIIAAFKAQFPKDAAGGLVRVFADAEYVDVRIVDEDGEPGWERQLQSIRLLANINQRSLTTPGTGFDGITHIKAVMKDMGILNEKRGSGTTATSAASVEIAAAQIDEVAYQLLLRGVVINGGMGSSAQARMDAEAMAQAKRDLGL